MNLSVKRRIISLLFCAFVCRRPAAVRVCRVLLLPLVLLSTFNSQLSTCFAQGTAFQYQGRLSDGGGPADGNYDLRFTFYDAAANGNAVSLALTNAPTLVSNGLFVVTLDFGAGVFTGPARWLDIGVRTNGSVTAYTSLSPRQPVLAVPYAIFANSASNLVGILDAAQLTGTLPAGQLSGTYSGAVSFTNGANSFSGAFIGDGSGLNNLNASRLTSGTVADARLSSNVPLLYTNQTFTGSNIFKGAGTFTGSNFFAGVNIFTNRGNSFVGSFFGNGLVGWIPTNGPAVQAEIDHGYLLTNAQGATLTLPSSLTAGDIVRVSGGGAGGWRVTQNAGQVILGNFVGYSNSSWAVSAATVQNWVGMAASADGTKMAAAIFGGGIYTSLDSGRTWGATAAISRQYTAIASSADGSKLAATVTNNFIFTSTNAGGTWVQRTSGLPGGGAAWSSIASSADGTKLVATVNGGGIYRSTDSGATWAATGASSGAWTSVASSSDGTRLVAANGGVSVSSNSGGSWPSTAGIGSHVASSADGIRLVAVGVGISTSADAGANWTTRTVGLPVSANWTAVASSSDGGKLAATVSVGGIFTSVNWGATWAQQSGEPTANWLAIVSSADGNNLAAAIYSAISGGIYDLQSSSQTSTTTGTTGGIAGGQATAVELQYVGNGLFMPVSSIGIIWAF